MNAWSVGHGVRRVVAVLVGDTGREDRTRCTISALTKVVAGSIKKVPGPPDTVAGWFELEGAIDIEPVARDVDVLAEGDRDCLCPRRHWSRHWRESSTATEGGRSPAVAVTAISSMPAHSSFPTAFAVIQPDLDQRLIVHCGGQGPRSPA